MAAGFVGDGAAGVAVVVLFADSMRLTRSRNAAFSLFKSALFFSRTSSRRKMSDVDCADAGLQVTRIAIAATAGYGNLMTSPELFYEAWMRPRGPYHTDVCLPSNTRREFSR